MALLDDEEAERNKVCSGRDRLEIKRVALMVGGTSEKGKTEEYSSYDAHELELPIKPKGFIKLLGR